MTEQARHLITNARLVNEGNISEQDLLISNGRIERIDPGISADANTRVTDAAGKLLMPGLIDDQVHFREPGLTHKGDIASESAAALAGGVTSYMEMPNVSPPTTTREHLAAKYARGAAVSRANYAYYFGAANDNIGEIRALRPDQACGIKVFMGSSTGNMLVDDPDTLEDIFSTAPMIVVTHCEDTPLIQEQERIYRARYGEDIPIEYHPQIRSVEACYKSSSLAVDLARKHDTKLHVLHLTTGREIELFSPGPTNEKKITVEVCAHHLWFCDEDYADKGTLIKCNPAIKTPADRSALQQAVIDGHIDVIATDHAPHTLEEKQSSYFQAPSGVPLVQHILPILMEHYHDGLFSLELIVQKTCHAPATVFDVKDRGYLREGYYADLVLVDPEKPTAVTADNTFYKCRWSAFEGYTFRSTIDTTWLNGEIAYSNGKINQAIRGKRLEFNRTTNS
jgi:dihydroorotase